MTRMSISCVIDEDFTVTGMLDDVVFVLRANTEIVLKYLTTFVVTSACHMLRLTLYPGPSSLTTSIFRHDTSFIAAHEKECPLQQWMSKGFRPYLRCFSLSTVSLNWLVRNRAQTVHLDVVVSLNRSVYSHTSSGNRITFFLLHLFSLVFRILIRDMIVKTLMCMTFFLCLHMSSFPLKEQCYDSHMQYLRVCEEETSLISQSLFVKL